MDIQRVRETIQKMLRLAEDPAAQQGEIDNAMRFVNKLMAEHQLTQEDIELGKTDEKVLDLEKKEMGRQFAMFGSNKRCEWEFSAASFACHVVGGVKYYIGPEQIWRDPATGAVKLKYNGKPNTKPTAAFYGIAEDVELARQVFLELIMTISALAKLKWGGIYRGPGREYCEGFMEGMWSNYYADMAKQKQLAKTSSSTALVAIDSRNAIVTKKLELAKHFAKNGLGLKLRAGAAFSRGKQENSEARAEGKSDGKSHKATVDRRKKLT